MDEQNVVRTYNGTLFCQRKEENSDTCNNMDGPGEHLLSEVSQTQKHRPCMSQLIRGVRVRQMHGDKAAEWLPGAGGREMGAPI